MNNLVFSVKGGAAARAAKLHVREEISQGVRQEKSGGTATCVTPE